MIKAKYDERHGGPYDRGGADYYYRRPFAPHYYTGGTGTSERVNADAMTMNQLDAYRAGYDAAADLGHEKDWG
mgnify:FL=1